MASRRPSLFCLYYCWMLSIHVHHASAISFNLNFSDPSPNLQNDIICKGDASISSSSLEVTKNRRDSTSRALYAQKMLLWNRATGEMASFTTNFSFRITMDSSTNPTAGDGLAFFLGASSEIPDNSTGGSLGLVTYTGHPVPMNSTVEQHIVAVEFDTFRNPELNDSSGNHIGIDLNSLNSTAYVDTTSPIHNLTSGSLMLATVSYDNRTKLLAVHLQIGNSAYYHVNSTVDLSSILPEEVNVGFSAATGAAGEEHQILSWSFSSTLEQTKHPNGVRVLLYVIIPAVLFLLVCAAVAVGFLVRRRRMVREDDVDRAELERGVAAGGPRRYTYRMLAAATSNFAEEEKLGRGGFGGVYRGHLIVGEQDRAVAIKVLSANSSAQGRNEFEAEVRIISRVNHRCLVQLLGWCDSRKGLLLVYELVAQGSLDRHLYNNERLLTWPERHEIILGLGSALRYLHGEWEQCVVHGDIKPSNIMLDSSYRTKLGDFGLAKLVDHGTRWQTTNKVQGTTGYIDPEFVNTGRPSTESDVYSFGIVLLEIVSGRRPVVETADGIFTLLRWVWNLYGGNAVLDAVDERLSGDELQMERALVIGLWCAHPDRSERPSIAQAMYVLQTGDARLPTLPPRMYTAVLDGLMSIDGITQSSATTANTINSFSTASPNSFSTALLGS